LVTAKAQEISTLSNLEYIELSSTLAALSNQKYNCRHCLTQYSNRSDSQMITEKVRRIKNCEVVGEQYIHQILQGNTQMMFSTCPGNFFSQSAMSWVEMSHSMEKGILPYPGGYMDQPNKAIEVLRIIQTERMSQMEKKRKEMARKNRSRLGDSSGR